MRDVKKVVFAVVLILTVALNSARIGVLSTSAFDPGIEEIYSEAVFMVCLDTDIAVYRKNEFERFVPASTSKIMTALLVLDNVENLNTFVEVTANMNYGFGKNRNFDGAQNAEIVIGQQNLTYRDLLYALMIYSACDAANILAYSVGGTIENFVTMMNQKALEIGCINTNFTNPHGLHENNNYTCAFDMFKITQYVYEKHPEFMTISATRDHRMPANSRNSDGVVLQNTNRMLFRDSSYYYEPARGVKTGSLDYLYDVERNQVLPGLFNLVSIAAQNGHTYMIVSLGAPYHDEPFNRGFFTYNDHLALYRWAFSTLEYKLVLSENNVVAQIPVINGTEDRVQLRPMTDFHYLLPRGLAQNAVRQVPVPQYDEINAAENPISRGQVLGYIELELAGETLTRINLIAMSDVEATIQARFSDNLHRFFFGRDRNEPERFDEDGNLIKPERGFPFGLTFVLVLIVLIFFGVILRILNHQREKNRRGISARNRNKRPPRR
jgi:D-alanyl-D-alanine carboxypeptidase (penicillin-binding protein 5/6)